MLRLVPALSFSLLVVLLICGLATAQTSPSVSFPSGDLTSSSFQSTNADFSSGFVVLDGSTNFSEVLYNDPFSLIDPSSTAALSFNSFFTVSANSTSANGTFAFVIVPDSTPVDNYNGLNTFAVVFNNSCYSGQSTAWGDWGGSYRGHNRFLNPSLTRAAVYANGQQVDPISPDYGQWQGWNGPHSNSPSSPWPSSCVQPDTSSLYTYQIVVQYNASAEQVTIAFASACALAGQAAVYSLNLSTSVFKKSMYAGFIASNGAVYSLSQWNFTTNATSTLLSTVAIATAGANNLNTSTPSNSKISKGYVVGFTLLGGGIGVATLVGACFLYRKRRVHGVAALDAASFQSKPTKGMINNKMKPNYDRDTAPLNPMQSRSSSAFTGLPTWLKPVAPR